MGKMIILTFADNEEAIFQKAVSILTNEVPIKIVQPVNSAVLYFKGLEILQHQHRVLRNSKDVNLTRLEYNTLVFLASNPGIVFTQAQIFEAVWNMDSDSCHSSVVNVIYNLRKKIEPDSKKPTYIKTVLGVGYKFDGETPGSDD